MPRAAPALLLLLLLAQLAAQNGVEPLPDPRTDETLRAFIARVVPAVEAACGRRFRTPPQAVLADAGDLVRVMRDEATREIETFYSGMPRQRIERALQLRADYLGASLIGKFSFADGQVLVNDHRLPTLLDAVGHGKTDPTTVLQLVIVHELVHSMQQQEIGLAERFGALSDGPSIDRLSQLIEGHAVLCSEHAASALGIDAGVAPLRAVLTGVSSGTDVEAAPLPLRRARGRGVIVYLDTAAWLATEERQGGTDRLWQLLRQQPQPEPPPAHAHPVRDLSPRCEGVPERLGGRGWLAGKGPLDEVGLLCENLAARTELRQLLCASCTGGAMLMTTGPAPVFWRQLQLIAFADEAAAERFVAIAEGGALRDVRQTSHDAGIAVADGPHLSGGGVTRVLVQPQKTGGIAGEIRWARRGRHVVQMTCVGSPGNDDELAALADEVLGRVEGDAAAQPKDGAKEGR